MLLIAFGLALLVIVAGMKLLIHIKNETLGNLYKYIALFVVAMGFLMLFAVACGSVCRVCFRGERMMHNRYGMMEGRHHGSSCEGEMPGNCYQMMHHRGEMDECCGEMMGGHKHHDEMEGNCCKKEKECEEGEEEECHKGKGVHEMEGCPMKKEAEFAKDSLKKTKHHPHASK